MTIQLIGSEDKNAAEDLLSDEQKWEFYIQRYIQIGFTEPGLEKQMKKTIMKR